MSQRLINLNPELKRLRDEGYEVNVVSGHLLMNNVPYVNSKKEVGYGTLVCPLNMAGELVTYNGQHVIEFAGEYPCNHDGSVIEKIRHASNTKEIVPGITVYHSFSSKPTDNYKNYYEKMTTYAAILWGPAQLIDVEVTPMTFAPTPTEEQETVFEYHDTASSRAGITAVTQKLELGKIAIVGVGGTGSYVLDFVAKTPVKEIHLFDGDTFFSHNAFRAPGAPSLAELNRARKKVTHFKERYAKMRRGIIAHPYSIDALNAGELEGMDFVFLCMDGGQTKQAVIEKLEAHNIPFVDTGMGLQLNDNSLLGILRVTTSTPTKREHVRAQNRISFTDEENNNEYSQNIQVAELNAMSAALAVIKWKKLLGFYTDLEREHHTTYTIDGNHISNEDTHETLDH